MKTDVRSKGYIVKLTVTLFIITGIVALMLGFVNTITKDRIAEVASQKLSDALAEVMPDANDPYGDPIYSSDDAVVYASSRDGEKIGYCVQVGPRGYGGEITLIVGVDSNGVITGVSIASHSETAGLGAKADDPEWLSQFVGLSGVVNLKTGDNAIDAVTGATVTSKAIVKGVNTALQTVEALGKE